MKNNIKKTGTERNILAITDFSKTSTNAIVYAIRLFKDINIRLNLLNIFETPHEAGRFLISVEDILSKDSETKLKKQANEIISALNNPDIEITTLSIPGKAKKVISSLVQPENIDLILSSVSATKYPYKELSNTPVLFMRETRVPILLFPENGSSQHVTNAIILNLDSGLPADTINKGFESLINHDHISHQTITLNEKGMEPAKLLSLFSLLKDNDSTMLIIGPAAGDIIDRELLDYKISDLFPAVGALLN